MDLDCPAVKNGSVQVKNLKIEPDTSPFKSMNICEKLLKVRSGNLTVVLNGFSFMLNREDVIYFPGGCEFELFATSQVEIFEVTLRKARRDS